LKDSVHLCPAGDDILSVFGFSTSDDAFMVDMLSLVALGVLLLVATFLLLKYRVGRV
jgi:hypothetical protein